MTQSAPLAANLGWIDAAVGRCYVASACMRADRPGVKAKIAVRIGGFTHAQWPRIEEQSTTVTLSEEWERYSLVARVNEPDVYVAVGPDLTATPDAAATVWIDAVQFDSLHELHPRGPAAPSFRSAVRSATKLYYNVRPTKPRRR